MENETEPVKQTEPKSIPIHPAANQFPMFNAKRFQELVDDIAANGQRESIKLYHGAVLDGRNRLAACESLGFSPRLEALPDDIAPWAYVWSLNGQRRDLNAEQRYLIWKHCNEQNDAWQAEQQSLRDSANRKRSETQKGIPKGNLREQSVVPRPSTHPERTARAAASKTNPGAVMRGDKLAKERPDLAAAVRKGELKPAEAHRRMRKDAVKDKVGDLPRGVYRVIYADPPWSYGDGRTGDAMTATGALDHYPVMSLGELKALNVPSIAAPDSVLFLWATSPLLPQALEVADAWGFTYKGSFVWYKVRHNLGHYNSVRHELLLICTRGSCLPDSDKLIDSVQTIERTKHSAKPERFREIIDEIYTHGPRIELFHRGETPDSWEGWGNESSLS